MALISKRRAAVNILRVFWVLIILWYELGVFSHEVKDCVWPDARLYSDDLNAAGNPSRPAHVLLVADPQIVDRHSYPTRGPVLSYITRLLVDLNLRKSWWVALQKRPDAIVFLGDMMDNGRYDMPDPEYEEYFQRFQSIFYSRDIPQYFIPGNHDTGLGIAYQFSTLARSRYTKHFGAPNHEISMANHSLIFLDAPDYADEDSKRHGQKKPFDEWVPKKKGALEFMKKFATEEHVDPVILFTHIPLYRPDGKSCGPLREHGTIRPGLGNGYQNVLEKQSSLRLLESFKPVAVFSGDDHDYCEYTHKVDLSGDQSQSIREITVKSISMVMNVRRPGFQLLSLVPSDLRSSNKATYADSPCTLPDQLGIYMFYILLLAISLMVVFSSNIRNNFRATHFKNTSDAAYTSLYIPNEIISDVDDMELDPYYSSGLPTPISSNSLNKLASGPRRRTGWFELNGRGDHHSETNMTFISGYFQHVKTAVHFFTLETMRRGPYRRSWLGSSLIDVRDIAVFPLGVFALINWWITYS